MKVMECIILPKENLDNDYIKGSYLDNIESMSKNELKNLINQIIKDTLINVGRENAKNYINIDKNLELVFSNEINGVTLSGKSYKKIIKSLINNK